MCRSDGNHGDERPIELLIDLSMKSVRVITVTQTWNLCVPVQCSYPRSHPWRRAVASVVLVRGAGFLGLDVCHQDIGSAKIYP